MRLSEHFALDELVHSQIALRLGLDNTPSDEVKNNLVTLCNRILEPLRAILGVPLHIDSGYRSLAVNLAIGGATKSAHMEGRAADMVPIGMPLAQAFDAVRASRLPLDQAIYEFGGWIHVAIARDDQMPRYQMLVAERINGKTIYRPAG